jgi:hypothetical protein
MRITLTENMSSRLAFAAFLIGTTFLIGGVVPNLFKQAPTAEAAVKQYTTSWTAKRMIQVKYGRGVRVCVERSQGAWGFCIREVFGVDYVGALQVGDNYMGGQITEFQNYGFNSERTVGKQVNIGVAEWEVKGQVQTANTFYKESWKVPGGNQLDFRIENVTTANGTGQLSVARNAVINNPGVTSDMFSVGYADEQYAMRFYTVPAPTQGDLGAGSLSRLAFGNGAVNCREISSGDHNCLVATGAYGWVEADAVDQGRGTRGVNGMGSFIPLRWTVTGSICETAQETACQ